MILQKLASAIRRQDWFQVMIEVMIVIVGIFLGLQVQEWNEGRKDAIEAKEYTAQLLIDTHLVIETIDDTLALKMLRADAISDMLNILTEKELTEENTEQFRFALENIRFAQPPGIIIGHVGDVLKGELPTSITNADLVRSATQLEQEVAYSLNRMNHGREMLNNQLATLDKYFTAQLPTVRYEGVDSVIEHRYYHPDRYNFEQMSSTPEVINTVQEALRVHMIGIFQTTLIKNQVQQFLVVLEAVQ